MTFDKRSTPPYAHGLPGPRPEHPDHAGQRQPPEKNPLIYLHHTIACAPRSYAAVAHRLGSIDWARHGGALYGVWRSQIGRPRDELTAVTVWPGDADGAVAQKLIEAIAEVRQVTSTTLHATLRPASPTPPQRQGNYAFRWFALPEANWEEFLSLCAAAWPGFESAYDSQVIGLWRCDKNELDEPGRVRALLLTRRPNLAMWERSKIPSGAAESEVRSKLSRRYDLCDDTWVHTTTLLTATDHADDARWT